MTTEQVQEQDTVEMLPRYFIDMKWYREQGRSFAILATSRLCPASRKKEKSKSEATLLRTIKQCCSKREGYITPNMPLIEMVFRLLLANGNQPLELEQIQEQLQQRLGDFGGTRDVFIPKLKRILDSDRYYGLKPVPESKGE